MLAKGQRIQALVRCTSSVQLLDCAMTLEVPHTKYSSTSHTAAQQTVVTIK